jgi:hypothetical protein
MIIADNNHVLFIEPKQPAAEAPIQDELTAKMRELMIHAHPSDGHYFGFHQCVCGAKSDTRDWFLATGQKTNSLAVHYLEYHRREVPDSELEKIRML